MEGVKIVSILKEEFIKRDYDFNEVKKKFENVTYPNTFSEYVDSKIDKSHLAVFSFEDSMEEDGSYYSIVEGDSLEEICDNLKDYISCSGVPQRPQLLFVVINGEVKDAELKYKIEITKE